MLRTLLALLFSTKVLRNFIFMLPCLDYEIAFFLVDDKMLSFMCANLLHTNALKKGPYQGFVLGRRAREKVC